MKSISNSFAYGEHQVSIETGEVARQAGGAVLVNMDDTVVLVTVVARKDADPNRPFFPLTVNYQEKTYGAGRIPGGFFKREGRPSEKEPLTSRLIDRPLRPLFPKGFMNETQVIATVMSSDPDIDADIPALIGASEEILKMSSPPLPLMLVWVPAVVAQRAIPTRWFWAMGAIPRTTAARLPPTLVWVPAVAACWVTTPWFCPMQVIPRAAALPSPASQPRTLLSPPLTH